MQHSKFLITLLAATASALPSLAPRQSVWTPTQGQTWNYFLASSVRTTKPNAAVMDIDLFDNDASTISGLKTAGAKVICYFSAGSYENWRTDWKADASEIGKALDGWPGEYWADIRKDSVRAVMVKRIALAQSKGCDAVDPDNVDGYSNDNGLGLTSDDSASFMKFLSTEAHARGLSIGLKNAEEIVDDLSAVVDFAVNEQCHEDESCDSYSDFVDSGKNVFHVEYPKGDSVSNNKPVDATAKKAICGDSSTKKGFPTIMKNINLDAWIEFCK